MIDRFEFYVLNHDFNRDKVEMFNIFSNIKVQQATEKAVKKYLRNKSKYTYKRYNGPEYTGFEAFCEELKCIILWEEWARCEYEIKVSGAFNNDPKKMEKWDCYQQALPNIPIIAREVIYQYKEWKKTGKKNGDEKDNESGRSVVSVENDTEEGKNVG